MRGVEVSVREWEGCYCDERIVGVRRWRRYCMMMWLTCGVCWGGRNGEAFRLIVGDSSWLMCVPSFWVWWMSLHRLVHSISQGGWQLVHQGKWRMELVSWVSLGHFHWIPWVTPSTSVLALMRAEFCSIWWILAYAYRIRFKCGKLSSYRAITDANAIGCHG